MGHRPGSYECREVSHGRRGLRSQVLLPKRDALHYAPVRQTPFLCKSLSSVQISSAASVSPTRVSAAQRNGSGWRPTGRSSWRTSSQATSRDILCYAMRTMSHCFITMHIHDELVIEARPGVDLKVLCEQMGRTRRGQTGSSSVPMATRPCFIKKD